MSLWDDVEETVVSKNEQLCLKFFEHTMNKEEQDQIVHELSKEVSFCNDDRKKELFEIFIKGSKLLKNNSDNEYLKNPISGMTFMSQLFKPSKKNKETEIIFEEFNDFIIKDYMNLANNISIRNEAELLAKLQRIKNELAEDVKFNELIDKTLVGIGGSFSAGKSSFLNAILNSKEDILPVETRPTTSIPTYIINNYSEKIYTFNNDGNKSKIDKNGLRAISHEFNEVYNFGLTSLVKNLVVYTPHQIHKNIAFLDTPGYSKTDGENQTDREIAKEYLRDLDALIWLIDSDNGTIKQSDIDFINELNLKNEVYVLFVINKADKKPEKELKDILKVTKENLLKSFNHDFAVTAYSSHDKKEYFNQNMINDFLKLLNQISTNKNYFTSFKQIFKSYEKHLENIRKHNKELLRTFNKIDIYGDSILCEIGKESLQYLEKSIKDELTRNKYEKKLLNDTKSKGIILLENILKALNIQYDKFENKLNKEEMLLHILVICASIDGCILNKEKKYLFQLIRTLKIEKTKLTKVIKEVSILNKNEKNKLFSGIAKVFRKTSTKKDRKELFVILTNLIGKDGKISKNEEFLLIILSKILQVNLNDYFNSLKKLNSFTKIKVKQKK